MTVTVRKNLRRLAAVVCMGWAFSGWAAGPCDHWRGYARTQCLRENQPPANTTNRSGTPLAAQDSTEASNSSDAIRSASQADDALPADFYGTVTYEGNYVFQSAALQRSKQGSFTLTLQINGQQVQGRYAGSNPLGSSTLTGTRSGDTCRLSDNNSVWEVHCGRNRFDGQALSDAQMRRPFQVTLEGKATKFTDIAETKRVQAAQAQAQAAALAALPTAGPVWTKKVAEIVEKDSKGWVLNSFDRGSVRNVRIEEGSIETGNMTFRGDLTINGGDSHWVRVKIAANQFSCIQFWDNRVCRGLKSPEHAAEMQKTLGAAVTSLKNPDTSGTENAGPPDETGDWYTPNVSSGSAQQVSGGKPCVNRSFYRYQGCNDLAKDCSGAYSFLVWKSRPVLSNYCSFPVAVELRSAFSSTQRIDPGKSFKVPEETSFGRIYRTQ